MSYKITSACDNCGACEFECPNSAIFQGDVTFEIKSELCTECVGFQSQPQCAAVCPLDCCVPDEALGETEALLIERAQKLHPNKDFSGNIPSRFRA